MITEDYVSFEIAKLLKEKGFDGEVLNYFNADTRLSTMNTGRNWNRVEVLYSAPTLQMAMKWLREKDIFVEITHDIVPSPNYKYHYSVFRTEPEFYYSGDTYDSYEKACEAGIRYCLENLI